VRGFLKEIGRKPNFKVSCGATAREQELGKCWGEIDELRKALNDCFNFFQESAVLTASDEIGADH